MKTNVFPNISLLGCETELNASKEPVGTQTEKVPKGEKLCFKVLEIRSR